jgi:hypothetical protein
VRYSERLEAQGFGVPHPWACCKINKLDEKSLNLPADTSDRVKESENADLEAKVMKTNCRNGLLMLAGLSLALLSGCQNWPMEAGITLPSPHYLRHSPEYFPPSPPFPLQKELNSNEEAQKKVNDNQ